MMNRCSMRQLQKQTEEQLKATTGGSHRILETIGHSFGRVENSFKFSLTIVSSQQK